MMVISTAFKRYLAESSPVLYIMTTLEESLTFSNMGYFVLLINLGNWFPLINSKTHRRLQAICSQYPEF